MFFATRVREVVATIDSKCLFCRKRMRVGEKRVEVFMRKKIIAVFCSRDCQQEKEAELMKEKERD